ncbi:MAG: helix-hairpin-helix domain-containing protein, partial [Acidobacteriota bacterium]|nr:helix-hairpin-helix domain-containing protein [Acidobacteriota bacterium]
MNKWEVARVLDEIAKYVELSEANRFKSLAFEKASRAISALDRDPAEMLASSDLQKTPGIGKTTAAVVEEVLQTGKSRYLEELRQQYPPGIFELLRVPRLGLKKVGILHDKLGIGNLDELEAACKAGRLRTLRGFGEKTEQKILEGIAYARKRESNFLLPVGLEIGEQIRERLADIDAVENAEVSGSVRRRLETIRNVNVAVATRDATAVTKALANVVANIE